MFYLAKTYYAMGLHSQSRKTALKASSYRAGWGAPFILIGDLYAQTSRKCGENTGDNQYDEFTKRVGYWAAIEKYQYAKKIDQSIIEEANKKIKTYSDQMPDKTSTFQVIGLDSKHIQLIVGIRKLFKTHIILINSSNENICFLLFLLMRQ